MKCFRCRHQRYEHHDDGSCEARWTDESGKKWMCGCRRFSWAKDPSNKERDKELKGEVTQ